MSILGCKVDDIACIIACMDDGGVQFTSISTINLSTCGIHVAVLPEMKIYNIN